MNLKNDSIPVKVSPSVAYVKQETLDFWGADLIKAINGGADEIVVITEEEIYESNNPQNFT